MIERRKNPPDRRTCRGRFAIYCGHGKIQTILNPDLIFLNHCPMHLKSAYIRLRSMFDAYMVDVAEEVAKRDQINSSAHSTNLSDGRRRIYGEKLD